MIQLLQRSKIHVILDTIINATLVLLMNVRDMQLLLVFNVGFILYFVNK